MSTLTRIVLAVGAFSSLVPGVWIFVATRNFAEFAAPWADYSAHFLRDAGAFQVGLGVAFLTVLVWREAIGAVLAGFTAGTLLHALSHIIDGDTPVALLLAALGALGVVALVLRVRDVTRG